MSKVLNVALLLLITGLAVSWWYRQPKYSTSEQAPDFTATLLDGDTFTLSDLRGDYVLLDFWGSWCGPCRRENPKLVALHQEHASAAFKIVSVAIEQNENRMINAIKQDGLVWKYHVPQLSRFRSPVAELYGVREIPTKYLINPEGHIIGVNMTIEQIDAILTTQL